MKNMIDALGKRIDLDQSEIVAYRSSWRVVLSKEAGTGRNLAKSKGLS